MFINSAIIEESESLGVWSDAETGNDGPAERPVASVRDGVCGNAFSWWWQQVERFPLLSPEREAWLAARVRAGDESAFEEMVESNLRLVVCIARRCHAHAGASLTLADLAQEGTIGLMRAVRKFDERRGYKFSTYACYWIRQAILRAMQDTSRAIRLPIHAAEKVRQAQLACMRLSHSLERAPSASELASYLNLSTEQVQRLFERVSEPLSLESTSGERENPEMLVSDYVADDESPLPHDAALDHIAHEKVRCAVRGALAALSAREAEVVTLRYGLDERPGCTLQEVASKLGLSRERVRQIEAAALGRMRDYTPLRAVALEG